jgi:hypothetical protein
MTRELYQRLIADLPHHAPWSMDAFHDYDLDSFADFTEIEIDMIRRNLHTPSEHLSHPLTANEPPTAFNSLSENSRHFSAATKVQSSANIGSHLLNPTHRVGQPPFIPM